MDLVTTWSQIENNLKCLEDYRRSGSEQEKEFYKERIHKGICFVILKSKGKLLWGPSRFIGYRNNSMSKHIKNADKDGRETNVAIIEIMNAHPEGRKSFEKLYRKHCKDIGIKPSPKGACGFDRKYRFVSKRTK